MGISHPLQPVVISWSNWGEGVKNSQIFVVLSKVWGVGVYGVAGKEGGGGGSGTCY
jgi:hypothetical protein